MNQNKKEDKCKELVIALARIKNITSTAEIILPEYRVKALQSAYMIADNAIIEYIKPRK